MRHQCSVICVVGILLVGPSALIGQATLTGRAAINGSTYYVATDGVDGDDPVNPGNGTVRFPWRTIQYSVNQLQAGDKLMVRGGTYNERDIDVDCRGLEQAGGSITIRAYANEDVTIDGSYEEFRTTNSEWSSFGNPAKEIWRSNTGYGSDLVWGYFMGPGGRGGVKLVTYRDIEDEGDPGSSADGVGVDDSFPFNATSHTYHHQDPWYYIGPGLFGEEGDGRIYYRAQQNDNQAAPYPSALDVPSDPDPNNTPMYIFPDLPVLRIAPTTKFLNIRNIDILYGEPAVLFEAGASNQANTVELRNSEVRGGRYHILVEEGAHDLAFINVTVDNQFPPYVAWTDVKRPTVGRPGNQLQGSAIQFEGGEEANRDVTNFTIKECTFHNMMDAVTAPKEMTNLLMTECDVTCRDDFLQLAVDAVDVEISYNTCYEGVSAGPSWNRASGAPAGPPAGSRGRVYIHHNVFDASKPLFMARHDYDDAGTSYNAGSGSPVGQETLGYACGRVFGNHSDHSTDGPAPWKIYYNTCVVGRDVNFGGIGHSYRYEAADPAAVHSVYNNIFVMGENPLSFSVEGVGAGEAFDGLMVREARWEDAGSIYDYNVYWYQEGAGHSGKLFDDHTDNSGGEQDFLNMSVWLSSDLFTNNPIGWFYYTDGWDKNSTEGDPGIDPLQGDYVPTTTGAADPSVTPRFDLWPAHNPNSSDPWPGVGVPGTQEFSDNWIGALQPQS